MWLRSQVGAWLAARERGVELACKCWQKVKETACFQSVVLLPSWVPRWCVRVVVNSVFFGDIAPSRRLGEQ